MTKDYDYATATEAERWAYDQGREDALDPQEMDLDDVVLIIQVAVVALGRIIAEEKAAEK